MHKSNLSLLAITLMILGVAVTAGYPAWGTVTGLAFLLLGAGMAIGARPVGSLSDDYLVEQRIAGQKISNTLVALSSAAILAVYATGYHRTSSAAEKYEAQINRRKNAAPIGAGVVVTAPTAPSVEATPTVPRSLAPPPKKVNPRRSSAAVRNAKPLFPPSGQSLAPQAATGASHDSGSEPGTTTTAAGSAKYKDGTYLGWGTSRHGDIQASVVVQDGQIISAAIATCATRYPCTWIVNLPPEVVIRQSPKVDYVSGATQSSDAFSDAVADALSKANE